KIKGEDFSEPKVEEKKVPVKKMSLLEKLASMSPEEDVKELQDKIRKSQFDYNDFLKQMRQLSKLGGMESVLKFLPGGRQIADAMAGVDPKHFTRLEAIILSMTPAERANPDLMSFSRKKRIAAGSGVSLEMVSSLVKQFEMMRKMMKQNGLLGRMMAGGMPDAGSHSSLGSWLSAPAPLSRKEQDKKKKKAKQQKKDRQKQRRKK
ncbi:MAG: hypothetical protein IKZ31_04720, partial [Lentisphaeria bacterium]|nr:hypothetical protein [Lentisphaeria bacterium]